jgi:uncharacterized protein DUF998
METQTPSTRTLLACGAVAGPLYLAVTVIESLTRDGFDWRNHRFSWLTTGDLGWIHQAAMIGVGALMLLLALGVQRTMQTGRGSTWAPRLLTLFGLAYVAGGVFRADLHVGFPPGTTIEMAQRTWHGTIQEASRSVSTLFLLLTSGVIAGRFASLGRLGWAFVYGAGIPAVFAALTGVGILLGGNPVAPAFLLTPWVWVTTLAVHLYEGESRRGHVGRPSTVGAR